MRELLPGLEGPALAFDPAFTDYDQALLDGLGIQVSPVEVDTRGDEPFSPFPEGNTRKGGLDTK